jgi:predicted metalloprotease
VPQQLLKQGDEGEAMNATARIGDDALQRFSGGSVVPESFSYGTSAQRKNWFKTGLKKGTVYAYDRFFARQL